MPCESISTSYAISMRINKRIFYYEQNNAGFQKIPHTFHHRQLVGRKVVSPLYLYGHGRVNFISTTS